MLQIVNFMRCAHFSWFFVQGIIGTAGQPTLNVGKEYSQVLGSLNLWLGIEYFKISGNLNRTLKPYIAKRIGFAQFGEKFMDPGPFQEG